MIVQFYYVYTPFVVTLHHVSIIHVTLQQFLNAKCHLNRQYTPCVKIIFNGHFFVLTPSLLTTYINHITHRSCIISSLPDHAFIQSFNIIMGLCPFTAQDSSYHLSIDGTSFTLCWKQSSVLFPVVRSLLGMDLSWCYLVIIPKSIPKM